MINRGGQKISLDQIEGNFTGAGFHSLCLAKPHGSLGQELAVLVQSKNLPLDYAQRMNGLLHSNFGFKIPDDHFIHLPSFPINQGRACRHRGLKHWSTLHRIPHRGAMLWVDEIVQLHDEGGGECIVHLKDDALYMEDGWPRRSSFIEFIAQSQGFITAALAAEGTTFKETFLLSVKNAIFNEPREFLEIKRDGFLKIRVSAARTMGAFVIFSGKVLTSQDRLVCEADLKVYAKA